MIAVDDRPPQPPRYILKSQNDPNSSRNPENDPFENDRNTNMSCSSRFTKL
jgi:hypothetical protein